MFLSETSWFTTKLLLVKDCTLSNAALTFKVVELLFMRSGAIVIRLLCTQPEGLYLRAFLRVVTAWIARGELSVGHAVSKLV